MRAKDELDAMLGAARFEKYFAVAGEDVEKAVQLYRWNTRLAGAFHSQLSYFEVLTRNAMNSALQDWNYQECGHRDWSLEHQSADLLYAMLNRPMGQARKWARKESQRRRSGHARKNAPLIHDDVVAQHYSRKLVQSFRRGLAGSQAECADSVAGLPAQSISQRRPWGPVPGGYREKVRASDASAQPGITSGEPAGDECQEPA